MEASRPWQDCGRVIHGEAGNACPYCCGAKLSRLVEHPAGNTRLHTPVLRLAQRYMIDPVHINLSPAKITVENIRQSYVTVDEDRKFELLLRIFEREEPRQCIIFCERKRWVEDLYRQLRRARLL